MGNRTSRDTGGDTTKDAQVEKPGKSTLNYPTVSVSKEKLAHMISEVLENHRSRYKSDAAFIEDLREIVDEDFDKISLIARSFAEDDGRQMINDEDVELAIYMALASSLVDMLPKSPK
ncbi:hypothetical protein BFW01_g2926 [Lasiodiplodia theobromae]|nr:hypothetical protein BFW01_g2926 [Lasiodiplodia theobromae]